MLESGGLVEPLASSEMPVASSSEPAAPSIASFVAGAPAPMPPEEHAARIEPRTNPAVLARPRLTIPMGLAIGVSFSLGSRGMSLAIMLAPKYVVHWGAYRCPPLIRRWVCELERLEPILAASGTRARSSRASATDRCQARSTRSRRLLFRVGLFS